MAHAIDRQKALDLVGGSAECEYGVGAHSPSRTVYPRGERPRAGGEPALGKAVDYVPVGQTPIGTVNNP